MPEKKTMRRVARDRAQGKAPSTQAGEFVREEIEHIREGKHGARSTKQAIAIGLSKARRAGVKLPAQKPASGARKKQATKRTPRKESAATHRRRSRAAEAALQRESSAAASPLALTRHAKKAARAHTAAERSRAAQKAVKTKGPAARKKAAKKAARTRAAR